MTAKIIDGKTFAEAYAELQRGIENVEVACGIPTMMQGYNLEDVSSGIDEIMIRQPLGVTVAITPFNFPSMIPLWFLPYAIATGNTFILKPSERVPLTARLIFELLHEAGLPAGVCNLVVGGKPVVDQHRTISSVFTSLTRANFRIDAVLEPEAVPGAPRGQHWADLMEVVPATVVFRARKQGT